ncbi:MAG: class I SAM-dependent methyltransferase [Myxococcota bacterium]
MSRTLFTGERLHEGDTLFALDLARHHAAYEFALARIAERGSRRVLDLGCGSGYGSARLAASPARVFGIDRIMPDAGNRASGALFTRADLYGLPLREGVFDLVVSFQVIEHLEDPSHYLRAIAGFLAEDGLAVLTTPNVTMSDGVNPYHVHEYRADELAETLRGHFHEVEVRGVGMSDPVREAMAARSRRIQRIMRLDPLGLRDRLPRSVVEKLFAAFAVLVRRRAQDAEGTPDASWRDFPIEPAGPGSIDLLALCRRPR